MTQQTVSTIPRAVTNRQLNGRDQPREVVVAEVHPRPSSPKQVTTETFASSKLRIVFFKIDLVQRPTNLPQNLEGIIFADLKIVYFPEKRQIT